jgi:hypothetical protein
MAILARHRVLQQVERLALGAAWPGLDLVFTSTTGTALEPRNVTREWELLRDKAGLSICGSTTFGTPARRS